MTLLVALVIIAFTAWLAMREAMPRAPKQRAPAPSRAPAPPPQPEPRVVEIEVDEGHILGTEAVEPIEPLRRARATARLALGIAVTALVVGLAVIGIARGIGALLSRFARGG